jgi:hypothetical protein
VYHPPGSVYQCDNWPKPLDKGAKTCHTINMKNKHLETELSPEVLALLNEFNTPNFNADDDVIDDSWLDAFVEDRFGGDFE